MNPDEVSCQWQTVDQCPSCGSINLLGKGLLPDDKYYFGREVISTPEKGVSLLECRNCGILFKDVIPSVDLLSKVFGRQAGNVWQAEFDYSWLRRIVRPYFRSKKYYDLLDIGPSSGALLRALDLGSGRLSGLDVFEHPGLAEVLRGEFIHGLIDSDELSWSQEPYDIVTAFDLFEHLYKPSVAMENVKKLLKPGGILILETGNVNCRWVGKYGVNNWWYVRLFEHHVFWSPTSIQNIAEEHGFSVLSIKMTRHKNWEKAGAKKYIDSFIKLAVYSFSPKLFSWLSGALGRVGRQPRHPLLKDHVLMVLQRQDD